jgi:uncharacterized damage-inducible protein DinB
MQIMDLRYPIGEFDYDGNVSREMIDGWINEIEKCPSLLKTAVNDLSEEQLNTEYRPGGWTVRQVVHHLADSHMNAYIRFKLALTETNPTVKTYSEAKWAELPDSMSPIDVSLDLLVAIHSRWIVIIKSMSTEELEKTFTHPDLGIVPLVRNIGMYAWHGKHHIAHITELRKRNNWAFPSLK